ncbi:aryl-sulfate sulfotransferase [Halocatena marina]|uniref:aryl-sulfate sulfotransferase n=1 Tax=Halocatena marina TaxID=2934937 RepID=UPI00360F4FB7
MNYSPPSVQPTVVEREPADSTIISIQGYNIGGSSNPNKPARQLSIAPNGSLQWSADGNRLDVSWFYDVDPLPDGDLLIVGTHPGQTRVLRVDQETRRVKWSETLPLHDTHDVTLTEDGNLLVANMRNTENSTSNDRLFVYNRTTDEIEWEWLFRDHYPNTTDNGNSASDWSHVNDVDIVSPGLYMISPRNFDQVIVVNRSTNDVVMQLGSDDNHSVLNEQHNPAYLQGPNGTPTILVADSENDRVVEYACDRGDPDHPLDGDMKPNCDWNLTWEVGVDQLSWPRDADRLPNGNTLVVDTLKHRVLEITPKGNVVWEYSAPWLPYDAERPVHGHEPSSPTMQELNSSGSYALTNGSDVESKIADPQLTDRLEATVMELLVERYPQRPLIDTARLLRGFSPFGWVPMLSSSSLVVFSSVSVGVDMNSFSLVVASLEPSVADSLISQIVPHNSNAARQESTDHPTISNMLSVRFNSILHHCRV